MAGRRAGKADSKRAAGRGGTRRSRVKAAAPANAETTLLERIAALERERDALRAALEQERARRRSLEEVYAAARGRIARALDSLHTILSAKA